MIVEGVSRPTAVGNVRRKLIFLWRYTTWGGAQVYFFAIMKLARENWDIVTILPYGSRPDLLGFLDELNVRYEFADIRFDPKPEPTLLGKLQRQYRRIRSEIKVFHYLRRFDLRNSVLHIEATPWQSWQLLAALALRGAKTFVTLHNFRPEISRLRELLWKVKFSMVSRLPNFHIFASNLDTKEQLRKWLPHRYWESVEVTYTCVDPDQISRAILSDEERSLYRHRFGLRADEFVILAVGQFVDRKGRWIFLDTAAKMKRSGLPFRFVWVMPNEIDDRDLTRIEAFGLGDSFMPVISSSIGSDRTAILEFFQVADVFALPSLVEGLPIALLEAMALRVPSISTNVYAIPEALKDGETGILIEADDSDELYKAILRLYNDADLRERLAEAGRDYVLKNFDEREAAAICIEAYGGSLRPAKGSDSNYH